MAGRVASKLRHEQSCSKSPLAKTKSGFLLNVASGFKSWEEALKNFGAPVADFVRIGLTMRQVRGLASADTRAKVIAYLESVTTGQ